MHELLKIFENSATRFVTLKNKGTNNIDECFDDSALISDENFAFMKIGKQYDCKIKLFGAPVDTKVPNSVTCKILNKNVIVGNTYFIEVLVNKNRYYVAKQKVKDYLDGDLINFVYTRKDLIQVDNVVHPDLY